MKKDNKRKKHIGLYVGLGLVGLLLIEIFVPFTPISLKTNDSYDYVLKNNIVNKNAKLVDIAMLGAHDAFTDNLSLKSIPNYNEGGIATNKLVDSVGKSIVIKMGKAQNASAKEMLYAGVRYFDARVSLIDGKYYTHHCFTSDTLDVYVNEIVEFLNTHKGEFIIFDIQNLGADLKENYNLDSSYYIDLYSHLTDLGLTKYVHYNTSTPIGNLTYNDITNNGTDAGVVLLAKVDNHPYMYKCDGDANKDENRTYDSIRSYWHNKNTDKAMLSGIESEKEFIQEHEYSNILRVNQSQKTAFIMDASLVNSFAHWSLLNLAKTFNKKLVEDEQTFKDNLKYMPIFMVDYATSNAGKFNELANTYIGEYNKTL